MRICQLLMQTYQHEGRDFIKSLLWQMLHMEEAKPEQLKVYEKLLSTGTSKNDIMLRLMKTDEAVELYQQPPSGDEENPPTVASRLQIMLSLNWDDLIDHIYMEILGRRPEPSAYAIHIGSLERSLPRISLIRAFLDSDEWLMLLSKPYEIERRIRRQFPTL